MNTLLEAFKTYVDKKNAKPDNKEPCLNWSVYKLRTKYDPNDAIEILVAKFTHNSYAVVFAGNMNKLNDGYTYYIR